MWYLFSHLNPSQVEYLLQRENRGDFVGEGEPAPEPVEYFIPYQFLRHAPVKTSSTSRADDYSDRNVPDKVSETDNGIREALHNYIFINADENRIIKLLASKWNQAARLHLFQYRDSRGNALTIADDEMRSFINTLRDRQLRYYIGQPVKSLEVGDTVTLRIKPWEGYRATITQVELRGGKTRLTVTLDILGNLSRITFPEVNDGDIVFDDDELSRLVNGNLLLNFEQEILGVLARRFAQKHTAEELKRDNSRLARLYAYRDVTIEGEDDRRRFTALMLLCTTLLGDKEAKSQYINQLQEWLKGRTEASTDTEAYLLLALFVAQRDPSLREAVKTYRNTHDKCPEIIREMFARVKRIRCR